jgi:hypothetical protein
MWEDFGAADRLVGRQTYEARKERSVSEDREKAMPEAEAQRDEDSEVEAHKAHPKAHPAAEAAAMEEGPDVEGHKFTPKAHPKAQP